MATVLIVVALGCVWLCIVIVRLDRHASVTRWIASSARAVPADFTFAMYIDESVAPGSGHLPRIAFVERQELDSGSVVIFTNGSDKIGMVVRSSELRSILPTDDGVLLTANFIGFLGDCDPPSLVAAVAVGWEESMSMASLEIIYRDGSAEKFVYEIGEHGTVLRPQQWTFYRRHRFKERHN